MAITRKTCSRSQLQKEIVELQVAVCGSAKLGHYAVQMRVLAAPVAKDYDRLVARLTAGEIGTFAPLIGDQLPEFLLLSDDILAALLR